MMKKNVFAYVEWLCRKKVQKKKTRRKNERVTPE